MDKMTIAIIGAGERGQRSYARYLLEKQAVAKVVAVADPSLEKRADMQKDHGITEEKSFKSWQVLNDRLKSAVTTNYFYHFLWLNDTAISGTTRLFRKYNRLS